MSKRGTAHIYGFTPWRTTTQLFFLVNGDAYMFYPTSLFPAVGACGMV